MKLSEHPEATAFIAFVDGVYRMHKLLGTKPAAIEPFKAHVDKLMAVEDCEKIGFFDLANSEPAKFISYSVRGSVGAIQRIMHPRSECVAFLASCGWPDGVIVNPVEVVMYASVFSKKPKAMLAKAWKDHEPKVADSRTRETAVDGLVISSTTISDRRVTSVEVDTDTD